MFLFSFFFFIFCFFSLFFGCLGIRSFTSFTCDLRDTIPRHRSLTLLHREAEDFPRGGNHSKHMAPLTYLAWLQPIYYNSSFVFIHINITNVLLLVKTLMKKYYFFQVQFLKILFFSGSVFENIIFFQVQFLKILLFFRFSFWESATRKT